MGKNSKIAWTDHTFNPWWGCAKVSAGCENCYAEAQAQRFGTVWGPEAERRFFGEKHWGEPLQWNAKAEATCKLREREPGANGDCIECIFEFTPIGIGDEWECRKMAERIREFRDLGKSG